MSGATVASARELTYLRIMPEVQAVNDVTQEQADRELIEQAYRTARSRFGPCSVALATFRRRIESILAEHRVEGGASGLALEDLYLALGCQAGDARAWRTFDQSLRGYLRRQCSRAIGNEQEGEELLADLYADLVGRPAAPGKIELYRGLASLATWLSVIIRRMALDRLRGADRRNSREQPPGREPAAAVEYRTPEAQLLQAEATYQGLRILNEALAQVDPRHRLVLKLIYWDGLTLREASRILGIDFSTVSRRAKTAREAIRKAIQQVARRAHGMPPEMLEHLLEHFRDEQEPERSRGGAD